MDPRAPRSRSSRLRPERARRRGGSVLLYGASGYTGKLVARAAAALDLPLVLGGRSPERLGELARELGRPTRIAPVADGAALRAALDGVAVVLNAAGPFSATAERLVRACLGAGVHYLDISGEVDAIDGVAQWDEDAREAGVMLMPGVGFDVVPSDCLAARLKRRLPAARHLRIGVAGLDLVSRGSARTILGQLGQGVRIRREGELSTIPEGMLEAFFDFGAGARPCTCVSWGDVVTAFHTTDIPNVEVYFEATPPIRAFQLMAGSMALFPPAASLAAPWMKAWAEIQPDGPTAGARASRRAVIVAEAEGPGGERVASRAQTPDVYSFTAACAAAVAARVLGGELAAGFQTPAKIFGETFVESFSGVTVEDVRASEARGAHR